MTRLVTPELLGNLLDQYGPALVLFAQQWTSSPEDCVQEALIELARQPKLPEQPVAWLFQVVKHRAISLARSASRREKHEQQAARLVPAWVTGAGSSRLEAVEVTQALDQLTNEQREVIVARIWGGLGFEEIAQMVGTSSSSAHRRYEAGLIALREKLELICPTKAK